MYIYIYICIYGTPRPICPHFFLSGAMVGFRGLGFRSLQEQRALYQCFRPKRAKTLYCPKTYLFKPKQAKMPYCPKKNKKTKVWRPPGPGGAQGLQTLVFLVCFGTVQHFCSFCLKKIGFFGTVQHFRGLGLQKRCTVPQKPIFLSQNKQKCRTVPKKPKKKQSLETPRPWRSPRSPNFGFFGFLGQYSIFALFALKRLVFLGQYSIFEAWDCKNAVLSQKNLSF